MVSGPRQNVPPMHHPGTSGMPPSILPPMGPPPLNDEPAINNWSQSQPSQPINNGTGIWENGGNKDPRLAQGLFETLVETLQNIYKLALTLPPDV